ncbi:hypothetical protein D3C84_487890 [compost metagenome]
MRNLHVFSPSELDDLLNDALHHWNSALPRRWLYRYGYLNEYARRSPLHASYHALHTEALTKTRKGSSRCAQSWPEGGFKLVL